MSENIPAHHGRGPCDLVDEACDPRAAKKRGEAIPAFLAVIDREKAALVPAVHTGVKSLGLREELDPAVTSHS